jgi:hypothetical protein
MTVTNSFFKILNVNASPTLSANPTKYPGLSVVSGNQNFETRSKYSTGSNQLNHQDMGYVWYLPSPLDTCSGIFQLS